MPPQSRTMGHMQIPRIIHWWWDGPPVPPDFVRYRERWGELHPDWAVMTWNEEKFQQVFEHHPVAALYFRRALWSPRAHEWGWKTNISRLLILNRMGGLWVDADLEPLKPVDSLIDAVELGTGLAVVAREDQRYINNAFLASAPDGEFLAALIEGLPDRVKAKRGKPSNVMTGPHYLTEVAARRPATVTVLDHSLIYPMHWSELDRRGEDFPNAYTLHHWHRKTTAAGLALPVQGDPNRVHTPSSPLPARPSRSSAPRKDRPTMKTSVPNRIRKLPGLTPEPVAIALADMAAQVPRSRAIVELGVYQGKTALFLAWGARQGQGAKVYGVDPWDLPGERGPYNQNPAGALGRHRKAFTDPGTRAWARYNVKALGYASQIRLIQDFSVEAGQKWSGPQVGLLFVDGDHRYDAVRADLRAWAPHLAENAVIAFDDYASTHPEVIQAVDDMVTEGILEPVQVFHDRLAVTKLGSGHPELVRRELEQMPEVQRAQEARQELADTLLDESDISVPRGGVGFPLPDATERDTTEREHPGTGEPMEGQEGTPDGTEHTLTETEQEADRQAAGSPPTPEQDQKTWGAEVPPASGRPVEPAGKAETVPMASADLSRTDWALPGEIGLDKAVRLRDMTAGQLRRLAQERKVTVPGDKRIRNNLLNSLRKAAETE